MWNMRWMEAHTVKKLSFIIRHMFVDEAHGDLPRS